LSQKNFEKKIEIFFCEIYFEEYELKKNVKMTFSLFSNKNSENSKQLKIILTFDLEWLKKKIG